MEDQPIIRFAAVDFLNSAGFEVLEARDADDAIRILDAHVDVSLVFTDVEMPGSMDGIRLTHYIRGRWPKVYFIVASGRRIVEEHQLPHGSKFFPKPYDESSIVSEMKRMLNASDTVVEVN